ncbi:MAG: glycosyltransferase family 4 protein [Saprospiraceae bacterium]|nr:glycosyltransferase family 4 protein [Saprospiraceae bacterium]
MKWVWIAPMPDQFISGGNIYNDKMIQALKLMKDEVHTVSINQYSPHTAEPCDILIWDTIYIDKLEALNESPCSNLFLLVHMINEDVLKVLPSILKKFKGFIVPSKWVSDQLILNGVLPDQIFVIEPGMDKIPAIDRILLPPEKLHLVQIANLLPEKGHEALLKAINRHMDKLHDFELDLFGDDRINIPWAKYILNLIDAFKETSFVRYKGMIPHAKIWQTLSQYQALLSVSPKESFGMAIQEAISCGLPVLAIRGGNISSLVSQGENGYLFDNVNQLMTWLSRPLDEKMYLLAQVSNPSRPEKNHPNWAQQAALLRSSTLKLCS